MVGELPTQQTVTSGTTVSPGNQNTSSGDSGQTTGGPFSAGKDGVGFPTCIYCPDPKYSEDARAAKVSGVVVLKIVVEPDGHSNIELSNLLGMGSMNQLCKLSRIGALKLLWGQMEMLYQQLHRSKSPSDYWLVCTGCPAFCIAVDLIFVDVVHRPKSLPRLRTA